jgi:hypothetical protein
MNTPVIFIVFNRPELTSRVFARIREARPFKLLVVCDGPRRDRPDDQEKVAAVRQVIAAGVDWPCDLRCEYSEANLGCRERVVSGLNWAFTQVEEAIILEDDCLPDTSFFPFCEELLARYRAEPKVMHIGGNNFLENRRSFSASYAFSRYGHSWGWATWRRAWRLFESDAHSWKVETIKQRVLGAFGLDDERGYWGSIFERCATVPSGGSVWDFYWTLTCWVHDGLAIYPAVNLVENIGIGVDATHTFGSASHLSVKAPGCRLPCTHPREIRASRWFDRAAFYSVYMTRTPLFTKFERLARKVIRFQSDDSR